MSRRSVRRDRAHHRLGHGRHARAEVRDQLDRHQKQTALLEGLGVRRPRATVGDADLPEHAARLHDRERQLRAVRGPDHDLDPPGDDQDQGVARITRGEQHLTTPHVPQDRDAAAIASRSSAVPERSRLVWRSAPVTSIAMAVRARLTSAQIQGRSTSAILSVRARQTSNWSRDRPGTRPKPVPRPAMSATRPGTRTVQPPTPQN